MASVEMSMAGQRVLLLVGFFFPGILFSESAKILTLSAFGECLPGVFRDQRDWNFSTSRAQAYREKGHVCGFQVEFRPQEPEKRMKSLLAQRGHHCREGGDSSGEKGSFPSLLKCSGPIGEGDQEREKRLDQEELT
jgi:hypothetical protein